MTEPLSHEEISARATGSAVAIVLRGLVVRAIGLIGNILLARLLLPRDFGMLTLALTIVNLGDFLANGGLAAALVRQKGKIDRTTLESVYGFQLAVTVAVAAVVTVIGVPFGQSGAVAAVMIWSLVFDSGRMPNSIVLEREMRYRLVLQTEIIETIVWNVWAVVTVALGAGVWGAASAQPVRALVAYVILSLRGPSGFVVPRFSWPRVKPLVGFGLKLQGYTWIGLLRDQGTSIAIAAVGGLAAVGVWSIVYRLTLVISVLLESLWRVSYPAMSRLREIGRSPGEVVERSVRLSTIMVGALAVPLAASAQGLIPTLFGNQWLPAVGVMPFAAASTLVTGPLSAVVIGFLLANNRAGLLLRVALINGAAFGIVGLPLLAAIGLQGLGIGALSAAFVDVAVLAVALHRDYSVSVVGPMAAPLLAGTLGWAAGWQIGTVFGATIVGAVLSALVSEIAYGVGLSLFARRSLWDVFFVVRRARHHMLGAT